MLGAKNTIQMKEGLIKSLADLLRTYRNLAASISIPSEIMLPDTQGYLPLYVLALLKSPAFRLLGEIKIDEKYAWILRLLGMSQSHFMRVVSPRLYNITSISEDDSWGYSDEETGKIVKPYVSDCTVTNMTPEDVCLVDNGEYLYMYFGSQAQD